MSQPEMLVDHLFSQAVDMLPDDRALYLAAVCKDDPVLRRLVESLLFENDRLSGFLSTPVFAAGGLTDATTVPPQSFLAPGSRLGRYTIQQTLGLGGMGMVYCARDEKLAARCRHQGPPPPAVLSDDTARRPLPEEGALRWPSSATRTSPPCMTSVRSSDTAYPGDGVRPRRIRLRHPVVQRGPPRAARRCLLTFRLCSNSPAALTEAHEQGAGHRDLKPANAMPPRRRARSRCSISAWRNSLPPTDGSAATLSRSELGAPRDPYVHVARAGVRRAGRQRAPTSGASASCCSESLAGRAPFLGGAPAIGPSSRR